MSTVRVRRHGSVRTRSQKKILRQWFARRWLFFAADCCRARVHGHFSPRFVAVRASTIIFRRNLSSCARPQTFFAEIRCRAHAHGHFSPGSVVVRAPTNIFRRDLLPCARSQSSFAEISPRFSTQAAKEQPFVRIFQDRGILRFWTMTRVAADRRAALHRVAVAGALPAALVIRVIAKNHFRMVQAEAVLAGWSMKLLRAVQSRSVNSSDVRAKKSQNQSAFTRSHNRSIGLKSGE